MTSKAAALEYLKQHYPNWILGGLMNSVWVEKDGERVTTGFRGERNCRQYAQDGMIDRRENDKGLVEFRWKRSEILEELAKLKWDKPLRKVRIYPWSSINQAKLF